MWLWLVVVGENTAAEVSVTGARRHSRPHPNMTQWGTIDSIITIRGKKKLAMGAVEESTTPMAESLWGNEFFIRRKFSRHQPIKQA